MEMESLVNKTFLEISFLILFPIKWSSLKENPEKWGKFQIQNDMA